MTNFLFFWSICLDLVQTNVTISGGLNGSSLHKYRWFIPPSTYILLRLFSQLLHYKLSTLKVLCLYLNINQIVWKQKTIQHFHPLVSEHVCQQDGLEVFEWNSERAICKVDWISPDVRQLSKGCCCGWACWGYIRGGHGRLACHLLLLLLLLLLLPPPPTAERSQL